MPRSPATPDHGADDLLTKVANPRRAHVRRRSVRHGVVEDVWRNRAPFIGSIRAVLILTDPRLNAVWRVADACRPTITQGAA